MTLWVALRSSGVTDANNLYRDEIRSTMRRAWEAGLDPAGLSWDFTGADPRLVTELIEEVKGSGPTPDLSQAAQREAEARRRAAELPRILPAADPMRSQWWFMLDSVVWLSSRTYQLAAGPPIFIGAPTVAHHYAFRYASPITLLDADEDVVRSVQLPPNCVASTYDVCDNLPADLRGRHGVAVVDPPWYPDITKLFISRARESLGDNGFILCVLPSRLTRPGLIEERTGLLAELLEGGFEVVALDSQVVTYRVPIFEAEAYRDLQSFGRPWRQGDLLTIRVGPRSAVKNPPTSPKALVRVFTRRPVDFRVFLRPGVTNPGLGQWIASVPEFEQTVSTRAIPLHKIAVWGTNKKAGAIRNASVAHFVLQAWAEGRSEAEVAAGLPTAGVSVAEAATVVQQFKDILALWVQDYNPLKRRTPEDLNRVRSHVLSDLASQPSARPHPFQRDQFRLDFQRDRDRILWSHALKRLANKTQVFPVDRDDHLRRRLSHSVEVMQLAATIARAFGLDPDLTESGALAHDLGHAPFGHAGEHALNSILNELAPSLGGFNHYEHGADVVRWLEDVYLSPGAGGFPGLNLTPETVECIFKHTYHRQGHELGQRELYAKSKHKDLQDTFAHLEGQAVRLADKISYLISDLEDGIRMGVLALEQLKSCRLFDRPPIDLQPSKEETLFDRFISQRRALLQVLMEDAIVETDRRLARLGSLGAVRNAGDYTVTFSPEISAEVTEVWHVLQKGVLHKDARVEAANLYAAKIVSELFLLFALSPGLIEDRFEKMHYKLHKMEYMRHYKGLVSSGSVRIPTHLVTPLFLDRMIGRQTKPINGEWIVAVEHIVMAKDYVASLTDTQAKLLHQQLIAGGK